MCLCGVCLGYRSSLPLPVPLDWFDVRILFKEESFTNPYKHLRSCRTRDLLLITINIYDRDHSSSNIYSCESSLLCEEVSDAAFGLSCLMWLCKDCSNRSLSRGNSLGGWFVGIETNEVGCS